MTKEEELDWLYRLKSEICVCMPKEWKKNMSNALNMAIKELQQDSCEDCISRQAAIDALKNERSDWNCDYNVPVNHCIDAIYSLPSAQPEQRWIPFKTRPLTKEEKEEYPECDDILDCKLPDDGQRILVSVSVRGHESVQYDEFYMDDGCYLDSGYEIGTEAVAWKPLPEPYREERSEE